MNVYFLPQQCQYETGISYISPLVKVNSISPRNLPKMKRRCSSLTDIQAMLLTHTKPSIDVRSSRLDEEDCVFETSRNKDCDEECSCRLCSCSSCCEDSKCDVMSSNTDFNEMYNEDKVPDGKHSSSKAAITLNECKYYKEIK